MRGEAKTMRAAALVEQVQTRDRAVQARAAAAAAANATLLQGLDAFRGVHLDPNASHWDEVRLGRLARGTGAIVHLLRLLQMGDDNDDFLDTTIEFGDGTQYKIDADAPPPEAPSRSSDYLDEPHPSDLATLEAPLAPGESVDEPSREERFKDDYDRTWSKKPLAAEPAKNLFNERLGKFEPYATGRKGEEERKPTMPAGLRRPSTTDLPPHVASHAHPHPSDVHPRRQSITSPRLAKATLPSQPEPRAWGRDAGPGVRRSSMEHGARRPSIDQGTRRPVIEQGGRQLPPHLAGIAPAQPQRGLDRHEPSRRLSGPLSPTLSHPPSSFSAFPPPAATLLPAKPSHLPPPPIMAAPAVPPPAPVVLAVPAPPPAPVTDLEELHTREMHAAAERAKKRRQEEEQVRAEQVERARKKAHELEEKAKLAAEAAALASKPAAAPAVVIKSPAAATSRLLPTGPSTDRADSWRERPRGPLPPAAVPHPVPTLARHEPTHILARGVPPHLASRAPQEPAPERAPNGRPAFVAAVVMAPTKPAEAAAEPTIRPSLEPRPAPPADERVWRRPDAPIAAPAATRQVPPHLAAELANRLEQRAPRPVETPARPVASMRPPAAEVVDAAHLAISTASTDPPAPVVTPPSPTASPRKTLALTGPPKAAAFKVPEMSVLEDLMSRIKGAMGAPSTPKIAGRDVAETVSRSDTSSPSLVPTVKLPAAKPSTAPRQPSTAPVLPATSLPVPDALEVVSKPAATVTEPKGKGRGRTEGKKPVRSPPPFENRDPLPLFESTKVERSQSPPPAWKVYAVRLPAISKPLRPPHPRQVKAFFNVQNPLRVIILTWSPPIPNLATRRLSRDDLLIPKQYRKGVVICPVHITKRRLVHTSVPPSSAPASTTTQADVSLSSPAEDPKRAGGRGLGSQRSWQRGALPQSVPEESCASSSVTPTVVDGGSSVSKASSDSDLAVRSDVAFYSAGSTPREEAVVAPVERADGLFMVTSELNGEVVEMTPRESLAAPGADALAPSLVSRFRPSPKLIPDALCLQESSSFESTTSTNAAAAPWSTAAPLSLSVLNPTAPSVWSPPSADSPTHARSISLGGAQLENSLQGIADPDDFPSAIPSSLADLKSEDEGSNEGQAAPKRGAKDEARLRAAAPSFSSYNVPETLNPAAPRYPYIRQGPSQFQSAGSPVGYSSQPFIPTSGPPHSVQYGQPHLYPSFSISPQPSYSATPMHQSYSPNLFASLPPSSQPPLFASYRPPPQGITNPALIAQGYGSQMSYGAVGAGGGAFGAVGAGGGGAHGVVGRGGNFARSPSMAPGFLPGYGNGLGQPATYRDGYRMPQADGRAAFGGYPASPIQMSQHQQHQPAHQRYPTQPQPYGGAFSPQLPNAHGPGEIGRGGAGGQGQVQGRHWQ